MRTLSSSGSTSSPGHKSVVRFYTGFCLLRATDKTFDMKTDMDFTINKSFY